MNKKQKKLFVENIPQLIDTTEEEDRAKGELKDLLVLESGLTDSEVKWLDIFAKVTNPVGHGMAMCLMAMEDCKKE